MNFRRIALALLLACAALPAAAQSRPKAVIELFTSQGCASCPPADALLAEFAKDPAVLALTMPVDYWDYIGWKDTLALHGHSLRQKAYADQRPDHKVFTPQAVINGVVAVKGSDAGALRQALSTPKTDASILSVPIVLKRAAGSIEVELPDTPLSSGGAELWACPVERSKTVTIGRGENGGRTITYSNVVRGWVKLGPWDGKAVRLHLAVSSLKHADADALVVLLQAGTPKTPGPILGAATLPLN